MPYDTLMSPDDPLERRMRVTYGSPPSGVSREQAASDDAARRFARRRLLMGLQGGLGAGVEAGGGFLGNLLRGASGALGGTLQAGQMQHEEERQAIRDAVEQRREEESRRRWEAMFGLQTRGVQVQENRENRQAAEPPNLEPWQLPPEQQASVIDYKAREARALFNAKPKDKSDERLVQVAGPNGTSIWVRESQAEGQPSARPRAAVTGAERTALAFYNRAKGAADSIETPDRAGASLEDKMSRLPLAQQGQLRYAPNILQSPEMQMYRQAQRAFTEARLRKESGAAIPPHEYDNDSKTYFAQPGDSRATIDQKRRLRAQVLDGLKFSSGRAYDEYYGGESAPTDGGGAADLIYNPQTGELEPAR